MSGTETDQRPNNRQIWILNHYAQEPGQPGSTRHFSLGTYLADLGWDVTVIAASVAHKTGMQRITTGDRYKIERIQGVRFLWIRTRSYRGNGLSRILNIAQYTFRVLHRSTTKDLPEPDIVVGSSVHPFAAWAAMRLARRHNVPFLFEVRDLWPQTLIDMGRIQDRSVFVRMMRRLEKNLFRSAARIITLLPNIGEYTDRYNIDRTRIVWIPNGVDVVQFPVAEPSGESGCRFLYVGALGFANDIENIIDAATIVMRGAPSIGISFRFVGDGPLKDELIRYSREQGISDVCSFEEPVPKKDVPSVLIAGDVLVISVRDLPQLYKYGISMNKLFDYMASARPVVAAISAYNNPVTESECGYVVPAGDPNALADAMIRTARLSREERIRMGHRGREYVREHYDYARLSQRFASVLDDV